MSIEVLLVDEDQDVLEIVETFLEQNDDLDVTSNADPETALELAVDGAYDIVVSDYKMPHLDGLELCTAIQQQGVEMPFLLFSAREPDEVQPAATEAGVTGFIQKGTGTEQYDELADQIRDAV